VPNTLLVKILTKIILNPADSKYFAIKMSKKFKKDLWRFVGQRNVLYALGFNINDGHGGNDGDGNDNEDATAFLDFPPHPRQLRLIYLAREFLMRIDDDVSSGLRRTSVVLESGVAGAETDDDGYNLSSRIQGINTTGRLTLENSIFTSDRLQAALENPSCYGSLVQLNLSGNSHIKRIPSLKVLLALKILNFSKCVSLVEIGDLSFNNDLKVVSASMCALTTTPPLPPNIQFLKMEDNMIDSIDESLYKSISTIRTVNLLGNCLHVDSVLSSLFWGSIRWENLTTLQLNFNASQATPETVARIELDMKKYFPALVEYAV